MQNIKNYSIWILGGALFFFSLVFLISASNFTKQGTFIEVKGLSERIVKADIAIWSINFEVKSNNIDTLYLNENEIVSITIFKS